MEKLIVVESHLNFKTAVKINELQIKGKKCSNLGSTTLSEKSKSEETTAGFHFHKT